jgi:sulfur relay (sulfurtransferase) DsrF/TusC family protein
MKALQIIESAYRCTIEEQDDPAVWVTHAMKNADADLGVLLRGNAVNYAVRGQDASGLAFGDMSHAHPPSIDMEINRFLEKDIPVYLVMEDAENRGIEETEFLPGIESVSRRDLPLIFEAYDQVWHW